MDPSPIVALNRAVAVSRVQGARAGRQALDAIKDRAPLENYHLFHAVAGQLELEVGETEAAAACFRRALQLATVPAERELLEKRLGQCGE